MMPIYIIICFFTALFIREKRNLEHTFFAWLACFVATPLFGKILYVYIMDYEVNKIRKEKERRKYLADDRRRRYDELMEGVPEDVQEEIARLTKEKNIDALSRIFAEIRKKKVEKAVEIRTEKIRNKQRLREEYVEKVKAGKFDEANAILQAFPDLEEDD
jgi:predicted phage gp36 major capsid-like protein